MKPVYKNSALNVASQVIIMMIMVVAMPFIIHGLGEVSFAILSLVWTVITYFTLWDFGIGRAVTKFVAEKNAVEKNDEVVAVILQAIAVSVVLGTILGILLLAFERTISLTLFKVPVQYHGEIILSLRLVAFAMPFLVLQGALRGALMGFSKFDLSNFLQIMNGLLQWGGALILVLLKFDVVWIIGIVLFSRILTTIWHFVFLRRIVKLKGNQSVRDIGLLKSMLHFGGWAMVSQVISPLLQYSERFILSGAIATGIVAFYVVPYEVASKMLVLSVGVVSALFPEMSGIHGTIGFGEEFKSLYNQSERLLLFMFLPIGAVIVAFAPEILRIWIGRDFASNGSTVFQILAVAFVLCAISQLPFTILQAVGRSDLTGKYHLIELPLYIALAFLLIKPFGLIGAGVATLARTTADVFFLYVVVSKYLDLKIGLLQEVWKTLIAPPASLLIGVVIALILREDLFVKFLAVLISLAAYAFILFRWSLGENEKAIVRKMFLRTRIA